MSERKFAIGDVARLKSGVILVTVIGLGTDDEMGHIVKCCFECNVTKPDGLLAGPFLFCELPECALVKVPDDQPEYQLAELMDR